MAIKKSQRHAWKCPILYDLAREGKPATCACGARLFYVARKKKAAGTGSSHFYGSTAEDEIIVTPDGRRHVNASPRPPCTRNK